MRRLRLVIAVLVLAVAAAVGVWWFSGRGKASQDLVLYGNVDLRQVALAFNNSDRIADVLVEEGDRVHRGELLASLDTGRLSPQVEQAAARVEAQRQVVERLRNGSRPEEIAQARASAESAEADAANVRRTYERRKNLADATSGHATVTEEDLGNAKAAVSVAEAKLEVARRALDLAVAGPRKEEIAQAEAELKADEAQLAFLQQELADAKLRAPVDAVVRTRLMEPGEIASPQKPVFSLAVTDPKWVRAYVAETDIGRLRTGMAASVRVDSFPDHRFEGWIGYVSPVAEFTPRAVQTEELRTSLVYEVRIFVKDAADQLRLGSPATVFLAGDQRPPVAPGAPVARAER